MTETCRIAAYDVKDRLCTEIDTPEDLAKVQAQLHEIENRTVYMCFSTDVLHSGHIALLRKAQKLGRVMIGVLSDEAIVTYKRYPLLPFEERKSLFESMAGVYKIVKQETLSYRENLERFHPTYVVHGDNWVSGIQKPIRDEVLEILATYGGKLVEYPYASDPKYAEIDKRAQKELSTPDVRRGRLRKVLAMKGRGRRRWRRTAA